MHQAHHDALNELRSRDLGCDRRRRSSRIGALRRAGLWNRPGQRGARPGRGSPRSADGGQLHRRRPVYRARRRMESHPRAVGWLAHGARRCCLRHRSAFGRPSCLCGRTAVRGRGQQHRTVHPRTRCDPVAHNRRRARHPRGRRHPVDRASSGRRWPRRRFAEGFAPLGELAGLLCASSDAREP